jgi:hypothetical protein
VQLVGGDRVVWIPRESNSAHIGTRDTLDNPENACTPAEMCRRIGASGFAKRHPLRRDLPAVIAETKAVSTTQLPSATDRPVCPSDRDFHPAVGAYSQAHSCSPTGAENHPKKS